MKYVFLTACRNEESILPAFLRDFDAMVEKTGISGRTVLYVVDDLSVDRSVEVLESYAASATGTVVHILRAPTNLGNQGALFHGLGQLDIAAEDVLVTFDCDGEDDVAQMPSIFELSKQNPDKLVYIERGRRHESLPFRVAFVCYKTMFRFLTRQDVIPNNFLVIPGRFVPMIRRSPLASAHFAYAVLKLKLKAVTTQRDRRPRYGGHSSQNLFMLASHGLVGLMVFYETVIAKLLVLLMGFGLGASGVLGLALAVQEREGAQRILLWAAVAAGGMVVGLFGVMVSAALALLFKMTVFALARLDEKA